MCIYHDSLQPYTYERTAISTWATGAPEGNISSFVAHIQGIVGEGNYENIIKRALHPNARTAKQRFSTKFPIKWYIDALASFGLQLEHLYWSRTEDVITHVLVDVQDFMFGNLFEPQRLITDIGFEYCGEVLGGEVIVYRKENVVLYLHGHPSIASDPRAIISIKTKQVRAITLDAIKGSINLLTGEIEKIEDMSFDNVVGSLIWELMVNGCHGDARFASAVQRDILMPDGISAIDAFRGGMTRPSFAYPCTAKARYEWKVENDPVLQQRRKERLEREQKKDELAQQYLEQNHVPYKKEQRFLRYMEQQAPTSHDEPYSVWLQRQQQMSMQAATQPAATQPACVAHSTNDSVKRKEKEHEAGKKQRKAKIDFITSWDISKCAVKKKAMKRKRNQSGAGEKVLASRPQKRSAVFSLQSTALPVKLEMSMQRQQHVLQLNLPTGTDKLGLAFHNNKVSRMPELAGISPQSPILSQVPIQLHNGWCIVSIDNVQPKNAEECVKLINQTRKAKSNVKLEMSRIIPMPFIRR